LEYLEESKENNQAIAAKNDSNKHSDVLSLKLDTNSTTPIKLNYFVKILHFIIFTY